MVTEPNIDVTLSYFADCPFCGDHSLPQSIQGGVYIGSTDEVINTGSDVNNDRVRLYTARR